MSPRTLAFAAAVLLCFVGCTSKEPQPQNGAAASSAPEAQAKPTAEAAQPLAARPEHALADDWCRGHQVPESMCTKCNPRITEGYVRAGDWCGQHGFPESVCPHCNPMEPPADMKSVSAAKGEAGDWCGGHGLPESKCTKCNPELVEDFKASGDWCAGHGFPESACPQCNPMRPPSAEEVMPGGSTP